MVEKTEKEHDSALADNISFGIKAVAYPVSIYTGYEAAASVIRNQIYKNIAGTGIFEADKNTIKTKPLGEVVNNPAHPLHTQLPDHLADLNDKYRVNVRNKFRTMGFNNIGDYWKGLNRNQMVDAIVVGMTVTGIVLGSMLTVANSKGLLDYFARKEKDGNSSPTP